ncbi:outer membrane protein assembly factor BamE domain-containing protein [Helicobacter burdigaliensis]|uniref:outer membrane protein assembly factor BamE domain-containing protein n=1 Tax=Helicobacter burdigaliensis TaxID=2315334 RepID=UPI000EF72BCF|nr:outer membrane protein assembly factor BamE [Helicobacter burdigaliensis]
MKFKKSLLGFGAFSIVMLFSGCTGLYQPQVDEKISVAKAQKDIKVGMSSAEVVEVMGSPNIISTDAQRREVWVYDKISTQQAYKNGSGGISIILAGIEGNSGSSIKSQRTLTIIIKFDESQKVRDVAYHTSSF